MSKAIQLFSGSSGNSIFISSKESKFLVDAGVSARKIEQGLSAIGEDADSIDAVFVTHEHIDHIKGLRVFATKHDVPVYANQSVIEKIIQSDEKAKKLNMIPLSDGMEINGIEIVPFELSHDSVACNGYRFNLHNGRSAAVCTDTGYVTDSARSALMGTDLVFLESNHEIRMLENGPYPYNLKQRILSIKGHLSNCACAEFARDLVEGGTTRICLSHLSRDNNYPDIARQTTVNILKEAGFEEKTDFRIRVSAPENNERPIVL